MKYIMRLSFDIKSEEIYVNNQKIFVATETVEEGKVVRVDKVHTPEGRSSITNYDMPLGQCWEDNDKVKYEAYPKKILQ